MTENKKTTGHELVRDTVYGPVKSRRYGNTFGINLLPSKEKICSFNCIYCQLGWTKDRSPTQNSLLPTIDEIKKELEKALLAHKENIHKNKFSLVISGNGEPTLHPNFEKIIETIVEQRNTLAPETDIICFTNGSRLHDPRILAALNKLDECCVKMDPSHDKTNLPKKEYCLESVSASTRNLNNLVIQSCIFGGKAGNDSTESINNWLTLFTGLNPKRIDLYTVSRKTPDTSLIPVTEEKLNNIKELLQKTLSCLITISGSNTAT